MFDSMTRNREHQAGLGSSGIWVNISTEPFNDFKASGAIFKSPAAESIEYDQMSSHGAACPSASEYRK